MPVVNKRKEKWITEDFYGESLGVSALRLGFALAKMNRHTKAPISSEFIYRANS
jgi:hypothetical protein